MKVSLSSRETQRQHYGPPAHHRPGQPPLLKPDLSEGPPDRGVRDPPFQAPLRLDLFEPRLPVPLRLLPVAPDLLGAGHEDQEPPERLRGGALDQGEPAWQSKDISFDDDTFSADKKHARSGAPDQAAQCLLDYKRQGQLRL